MTPQEWLNAFATRYLNRCGHVHPDLLEAKLLCARILYHLETVPPKLPHNPSPIELARHKDAVESIQRKYPDGIELFATTLERIFLAIPLPPLATDTSRITIPLIDLLPPLGPTIQQIYKILISPNLTRHKLFRYLQIMLTEAVNRHREPDTFRGSNKEIVDAYFSDTPLHEIFYTPIPFSIPLRTYKEHGFLFARSGHGKSATLRTLLSGLIHEDCALILIDGNGSLIENVDRIDAIKHRLVIIDPDDKPSLNFLKIKGAPPEKENELFFYLFKALDQELTPQQTTMVAYMVDFLKSLPFPATLDTLKEICDPTKKQMPYLEHLPLCSKATQDFFNQQFIGGDAYTKATKSRINYRLQGLAMNRRLLDVFDAPDNTFDAYQCMEEKKIVVVDAHRNKLGDLGSAFLGRYVLAQCLAAAWRRKRDSHLALIIVDEAKEFLDDHSKKFFSDTRGFGVGMLFATQFIDQLDPEVRDEVITNTSIRFAGPMGYTTATRVSRDMRTTADFIIDMQRRSKETDPPPYYAEWACFVSGMKQAMKITVPFGELEKLPWMDDLTYKAMREANRKKYSTTTRPPRPITTMHRDSHVTFPDYGVTLPCMLDTGADGCSVQTTYTHAGGNVTFKLGGREVTLPILYWGYVGGITGEPERRPYVCLKITVGVHTAETEISLASRYTLIGKTFLDGRIIVSTDDPKNPKVKTSQPTTPQNIPEPPQTNPFDTEH